MRILCVNGVNYNRNVQSYKILKDSTTYYGVNNQESKQPNFKGKKLEFFLDLAWTSALSAATGFMGAGLGSAYMLNKYVINSDKKDK